MLCASGTCSAPTGAGAEKRWQNNNLCELGNRSGTGRKESASDRRGPTRKPDNQLGKSATGHRRHRASELAEKETMPVIVRDLDGDAATFIMVDSVRP